MDKTIQKNIVCYFNCLENHVIKWDNTIENLQRPSVGLKNQIEQFSHVDRVKVNEEFAQFPFLKEKLLFKIMSGIEEELTTFKRAITELNSLNQDLRNKLVAFEKSTSNFEWCGCDEDSGSAYQPRLSNLLQMGLESWTYYSEMYQNIVNSFKTLDIRNDKSVEKFICTLKIDSDIKNRIKYILALTQYCNKQI